MSRTELLDWTLEKNGLAEAKKINRFTALEHAQLLNYKRGYPLSYKMNNVGKLFLHPVAEFHINSLL